MTECKLTIEPYRRRAGYATQEEAAQALGMTWRRYSSLERGETRLLVSDAVRMSDVFGCTPNDLYLEYLDSRPLERRIELPAAQRPVKRLWDAGEAAAAVRLLEGWRHETVPLVMLGAGLRREEAFGLRGSDLELRDGTLYVAVRRAFTPEDGLKPLKTAASARVAIVPEPIASRLLSICPAGTIVPNSVGGVTDPNRVCRRWRALFDEGGRLECLPRITLNQLRHVHETMMVSGGVAPSVAAKLHGHSAPVQYGHYLGVSGAEEARAADVVGRALSGR